MRVRTLLLASALGASAIAFDAPARADDTNVVQPAVLGQRYAARRQGMFATLGAWSMVSMGGGGALAFGGTNDFDRFFGVQALAWGAVNLAFSIFGVAQSKTELFTGPDAADAVKKDRASLAKVFWINAILDIGYVIAGTLLWNLGANDIVRGTGAGIVAQGGFLFAFDSVGYTLSR
ncbi:hypothetical protein BH09MYX1_BH09MYX1_48320 [soil metagenome]